MRCIVMAMRLAGPRLISTILIINHGIIVVITTGGLYAGFVSSRRPLSTRLMSTTDDASSLNMEA